MKRLLFGSARLFLFCFAVLSCVITSPASNLDYSFRLNNSPASGLKFLSRDLRPKEAENLFPPNPFPASKSGSGKRFLKNSLTVQEKKWRDYYRRKLIVAGLKRRVGRGLLNYTSDHPSITKALEMVREGKEEIAFKILQAVRIGVKDILAVEETIFITGFIYENLGFYPEALGNYERLIFPPDSKSKTRSSFLKKARLRRAYIQLALALELNSESLLKKAGAGFYRVSGKSSEAKEALAGHALTLYESGDYRYAEVEFRKLRGYLDANPLYLFVRAENYLRLGRIKKSRAIFQRLSNLQRKPDFQAYLYLRIGDLAVLEGRKEEGESFYQKIIKEMTPFMQGWVMGKLAISELYLKEKKMVEAGGSLKSLLKVSLAPEIKGLVLYYLIQLSRLEGSYAEALSFSKELIAVDYSVQGVQRAKEILENLLGLIISDKYEKGDYQGLVVFYYRNKAFIRERRILSLVGESLLELGLPLAAREIYKGMGKKGGRVSIGLAKTYLREGDFKMAETTIEAVRPAMREEERYLAGFFRELGDLYFRRGRYRKTLRAYLRAEKGGGDKGELELKIASVYYLLGEEENALKIYLKIINDSFPAELKARAYLNLGDIYYARKMWSASLSAYIKGREGLDKGERFWFIYRLGELNLLLGNKEKALKRFKKVVQEDKSYLARLAAERLKEVALWQKLRM